MAIVVLLVTRGVVDPLQEQVSGLRNEIADLKRVIETQSDQIRILEGSVSKLQAPPAK